MDQIMLDEFVKTMDSAGLKLKRAFNGGPDAAATVLTAAEAATVYLILTERLSMQFTRDLPDLMDWDAFREAIAATVPASQDVHSDRRRVWCDAAAKVVADVLLAHANSDVNLVGDGILSFAAEMMKRVEEKKRS